jgi:hypothetical protein
MEMAVLPCGEYIQILIGGLEMKKFISIVLVATLLFSLTSFGTLAVDTSDESAVAVSDGLDTVTSTSGYYISGYAYGLGTSRVSYNTNLAVITITGPTGYLTSFAVAGSGYVEFGTQSGNTYTASAPGFTSSSWVST